MSAKQYITQTVKITLLLLILLQNEGVSRAKEGPLPPPTSTIDLFVFRSSTRINFETPRTLFFSTVKSYLTSKIDRLLPGKFGNKKESMLGHVSLHYNCGCKNWKLKSKPERWLGQTGQKNGQGLMQILNGSGLAPTISVYADGKLESDIEVKEMLESYTTHPEMVRVLRIKTSCEVCTAAAQFIDEYEESGASQNYTLTYQPKAFFKGKSDPHRSGGGCGSFAAGVLSRSNAFGELTSQIIPNFAITRNIPLEIVSLTDVSTVRMDETWEKAVRAVSTKPQSLFAPWTDSRWDSWGKDHPLLIVDPEWYYDWINGASKAYLASVEGDPTLISTRSELSLIWGSSGSLSSLQTQILNQEKLGAQAIAPLLKQGKVRLLTKDSPYRNFDTLEFDMTH